MHIIPPYDIKSFNIRHAILDFVILILKIPVYCMKVNKEDRKLIKNKNKLNDSKRFLGPLTRIIIQKYRDISLMKETGN